MAAAGPGLAPGQVWAQTSTVGSIGSSACPNKRPTTTSCIWTRPSSAPGSPLSRGSCWCSRPARTTTGEHARRQSSPVFDAIGRETVWLEEVGAATRLKLVANTWVAAVTAAAGEALALAHGLGVDPQAFLDSVRGGPLDCGYLHAKAAAILSGDFTPNFTTALAAEITSLIAEAGVGASLHMDVMAAAVARFQHAEAQGHGDHVQARGRVAS